MKSKKILLVAYAVSPSRGSEYSVAWNYILNMSIKNELLILYGTSDDHLGDIESLEAYLSINKINNARFVAVQPNRLATLTNILNKKGIFPYSFYLSFNIWHRIVFKKVKKIISDEKFDLIHYLVPIGYREPGYLWKLNIPYMWGPIGGTGNTPIKLFKALPFKGKLKLGTRSIVNFLQLRIKPRLKKALKRSDVIMTATTTDCNNLSAFFGEKSYYLPENGIMDKILLPDLLKYSQSKIKIIWIGRIDANKALIILLKALVLVRNKDKIQINIVGDGPLKKSLYEYSIKALSDIEIIWHGSIEREHVFKLLTQAHIHIITSLTEANTTVIWEAMSKCVPTISLDHFGMHDTICNNCGIKIPIYSYTQIIKDYALQIDKLVENPDEIKRLSLGVYSCAQKYTWEQRREFFNKMYDLAIANWKKKNKYDIIT